MLRSKISTHFIISLAIFQITAGVVIAEKPADPPLILADTPIAAYDIVTREALSALPVPIRPYFESRLEQIRLFISSTDKNSPLSHYVLLDVSANIEDWDDRVKAARQFPHQQKIANNFFRENRLHERTGQLPWVILEHFDELTQAFQTGDENKITARTASLLHFATDACWPMNTTIHRFESNSPIQSPSLSRIYLESALAFDSLREQLSYEVRVSPHRYRILSNPTDAVFNELLSSFSTLIEIERIAKNNWTDDRIAQIFEQRLESAAVLAVRLIGTAWENASKPTLGERVHPVTQSISSIPGTLTTNTPTQVLMGSKNSGIVHRITCRHAKRIKSANIIRFTSFDEALRAGRKGCKTCKSASKSP